MTGKARDGSERGGPPKNVVEEEPEMYAADEVEDILRKARSEAPRRAMEIATAALLVWPTDERGKAIAEKDAEDAELVLLG